MNRFILIFRQTNSVFPDGQWNSIRKERVLFFLSVCVRIKYCDSSTLNYWDDHRSIFNCDSKLLVLCHWLIPKLSSLSGPNYFPLIQFFVLGLGVADCILWSVRFRPNCLLDNLRFDAFDVITPLFKIFNIFFFLNDPIEEF